MILDKSRYWSELKRQRRSYGKVSLASKAHAKAVSVPITGFQATRAVLVGLLAGCAFVLAVCYLMP